MGRSDSDHDDGGFVDFYRRYSKTWVHGVATAALTAFGLLTFVHRLFAGVALAAYVLPPLVLYVTGSTPRDQTPAKAETTRADDRSEAEVGTETEVQTRSGDATGTEAGRDARTARTDASPTGEGRGEPSEDGRPRSSAEAEPGTTTAAETDPTHVTGTETDTDTDTDAGVEADAHWTAAETPTDETLTDVVVTGSGAYAVGEDGTVLARGTDGWEVAVTDGPATGSNALHGVDATDGGVWFAGDGGALGRLDPATDRHVDHSAPDGDTTNLTAVAAAGDEDTETVLLADGSGRVRRGRWRDGSLAWDAPVTPGSGSSLVGVTLVDESVGYACDTNDGVFRTTDGGASFERLDVDASGTLTDVAAGSDGPLVTADDGVLHRYDGTTWTPTRLDEDGLHALAVGDGRRGERDGLVGGDGGVAYERRTAPDWERVATPATVALSGVGLGDRPDGDAVEAVAVGGGGTVVERLTAGAAGDGHDAGTESE